MEGKVLYIEETARHEKAEKALIIKKYVKTLKICGFRIVLEKVQKNKKKTCIIALD